MKYAIVTFGCRVNQADSLAIEGGLRTRGATAAAPEHADVIVVNTCSVTANADQGARQVIRRVARANPGARIVVTGCYATRAPGELAELPNVARIITNALKDDTVDAVMDAGGMTTSDRFGDGWGSCGAPLEPGVAGRTALTLRVQTGCDERCSYCIIPRTRGAGRSKPLAEVLGDISRAVAAGYKEIAITGVHLGSYGSDLDGDISLVALVRALAEWPDTVLFRISSLEPMDCTPDIVDLVSESPRLAPHFHLPLQHGSDDVLAAMRRPYTARDYRGLVERIRTRIEDAAIGSDVIVGFPGEGDREFAHTRALLDALPLTSLHVFPYSDRPGTEASRLPGHVDGRAIRTRGAEIRAIGHRMATTFRQSQSGKTRRALTVDDGRSAVTDNYLKVRLEEAYARNEWIDVRLGGVDDILGFGAEAAG